MTRTRPEEYEGAFLDFEGGTFSADVVQRIVDGVEYPLAPTCDIDGLQNDLDLISRTLKVRQRLAVGPNATDERKYLLDLRRTARRLARLVPLVPACDAEFPPEPSLGLMRLLEHPMQVEIDARLAREVAEAPPSIAPQRRKVSGALARPEHIYGDTHPIDILTTFHEIACLVEAAADRAIRDICQNEHPNFANPNEECVVSLMKLYRRTFGRDIGFSRPGGSGKADGPMIRFVSACCAVLQIKLQPDSIGKIMQRRFPNMADRSA